MSKKIYWIDFDKMEQFMVDVFKAAGVPEEDAKICADVLITSDKRGIDSHGIGRLKPIYIDRIMDGIINPVTEIKVVKEGPTTAVLDGQTAWGRLSQKAMEMAIEKAENYGMGMVAVRNSNHTDCRLLCSYGNRGRHDRHNRYQCQAFNCAYLWGRKHAGYQPPHLWHSHR